MKKMKEKVEWFLFDAKEDPKTKETAMYYTDGTKIFGLMDHPTRAFNYYIVAAEGLAPKEAGKLVNAWIKNAIGPAAEFYDRILKFEI